MNYIASWVGGYNPIGSISSKKGGFYYSGHLLQVKKTALNSDFYRFFFHDFIQAGAGADNSNGVNFEHHRKLLSLNICCKFQKDYFEL